MPAGTAAAIRRARSTAGPLKTSWSCQDPEASLHIRGLRGRKSRRALPPCPGPVLTAAPLGDAALLVVSSPAIPPRHPTPLRAAGEGPGSVCECITYGL